MIVNTREPDLFASVINPIPKVRPKEREDIFERDSSQNDREATKDLEGSQEIGQDFLTVSELSKSLRRCVESNFFSVRVKGEISSFKRHSSGHLYFSLKDNDSVLNAVCWRGTHLNITMEDGLEVIASGRLSIYPGRSSYQMIVSQLELAGEGALFKLLAQRKEKLAKEGLFDRKRTLPAYPRIVGVVTSPTGAVIQDILHRISDRYPCRVILWPVLVQGQGAAEQIAAAIKGFNSWRTPERPDLLIVARGGGSIEDLWAFNEEVVVRAAAESDLPIISAVGHETDTTLIDYAADLRAPTPTAAAELATPVRLAILEHIQEQKQRLVRFIRKYLETQMLTLRLHKVPSPLQWMESKWIKLDENFDRLQRLLEKKVLQEEASLRFLKSHVKPPYSLLSLSQVKLEANHEKLNLAINRILKDRQDSLDRFEQNLKQNSYTDILKKGFCFIGNQKGEGFFSRQAVLSEHPDQITLHFLDGKMDATPIYDK